MNGFSSRCLIQIVFVLESHWHPFGFASALRNCILVRI